MACDIQITPAMCRKHNENNVPTCSDPYQKKTMGMIWQSLGHMWPICGNGMGSLVGGMELMWDLILAKCNLWKIYGKKT